jgi:cytoskeleton protein RodZ
VSIGQALSAARRDAGLTVDDISAKTRLRATVVRAIEADDFTLCGGDFYARGHIRTLAGLVGLDPAPLLAEYDATIGTNDEGPATTQLYESEVSGRAINRTAQKRAPHWGMAGAAMVLVVIIIFAVIGLTNHGGKGAPAQAAPPVAAVTSSAPPASPSPAAPVASAPAASPIESPTEVAPSTAVAEAGVHIVLLVTTKKCWVEALSSTDQVLYQGVLNPGETRTWDDPQKLSLHLGNAPATDLTVNGVDIGAPPSKTAVTTVSFGPGNPLLAQG